MNLNKFMLKAINESKRFKFTAKPNPVVGAILVKDKEIISEGYHEFFGKNHAEINAIIKAKKLIGKKFNSFDELTLICTLEPCCHHGKTGPCTDAIVESGIKNVVIGALDPNPKVSGKGIKILKENNINILHGVLEKEVEKSNEFFFFKHKTKKPYITVKIARSLNDVSYYANGFPAKITSKESRNDVQTLRANYDAILTGGNTIKNDNPRMNTRVDFATNQSKKILLSSKKFDKEKYKFFYDSDIDIHLNKNLKDIISCYTKSEINSILIEAGPKLTNSFLESGLVDSLIIYSSSSNINGETVKWKISKNTISNLGFKLESRSDIGSDIKEIYKNE